MDDNKKTAPEKEQTDLPAEREAADGQSESAGKETQKKKGGLFGRIKTGVSSGFARVRALVNLPKVYRFFRDFGIVLFALSMLLFIFTKTTRHIAIFAAGLGIGSAVYGFVSLRLESIRFGALFKLAQIAVGTLIQLVILSFIVVTAVTADYAKSDVCPLVNYCIVPGAQVVDGKPGEILQTRIVDTADYLREFTDTKAILCGGATGGEQITEAQCMYDALVTYGVDPNRLILEDTSHDTEQNLRNAKAILDGLEGEAEHKVVIISSEYHLMRCRNLARKVGLNAFVYHVNTPRDAFILEDSYVREYFSNMIYIVELITRRS